MTIASLFPLELKTFLQKMEESGFLLCLVGGAPRDFLMSKILSHDLDFEVRGKDSIHLKKFFKDQKIIYTELPYDILRVDHHGVDLEFSPPRVEKPLLDNKSHHHFEAVVNPAFTYFESFKRRDFTLNAIGIEFSFVAQTEVVIDPYNGVVDLKNKVLKEVSDDFFLDSVRFLRLVRFSIKYNLEIATSVKSRLNLFDLSELSVHHFKTEMMKSKNPGVFINRFNELVKAHGLKIPENYKFFQSLVFSKDATNADDLLVETFLTNKEKAPELATFFSLPLKKLKDLTSFYDSYLMIKNKTRKDFVSLSKLSLKEMDETGILKDLKNLEEKKEWRVYFSDDLPISWKDWSHIQISKEDTLATPVALRSYVRFYHAIKEGFSHD